MKKSIDVGVNNKRFRKSWSALNIKTEAEAIAVKERIKAAMLRGDEINDSILADIISPDINLRELYRRASSVYWQDTKHGADMIKMSELIMAVIGETTLVKNIDLNKIDELVAYCKSQGNSDATINRKLSNLSKVLTYAVKRGIIDNKPSLEWKKEHKGRIRYFSFEEERKMIELLRLWSYDEMADYVLFLMDTGLRRDEALRLTPDDYLNGHIIVWEKSNTKNRKSRTVPLISRADKIVKARLNREGKLFKITKAQLKNRWARMRGNLGKSNDKEFVLHTLRHTYASRLAQQGVSIQIIAELLGHSNTTITMKYAHLSVQSLGKATEQLERAVERKEETDILRVA